MSDDKKKPAREDRAPEMSNFESYLFETLLVKLIYKQQTLYSPRKALSYCLMYERRALFAKTRKGHSVVLPIKQKEEPGAAERDTAKLVDSR